MKAQTSRTPEDFVPVSEEVTPVIIKIGGGDVITETANPMTINIDSYMPFSDITGGTWHEALSTKTGRIHELSLTDGSLNPIYCPVSPQPDVLTSLELKFAEQEQFKVSEVKDDTNGAYLLKIESSGIPSGTSFHVTEKAPGEGDWYNSHGTFTSNPLGLVFKQKPSDGGDDIFKLEYTFNNTTGVRFTLDFHVDLFQ